MNTHLAVLFVPKFTSWELLEDGLEFISDIWSIIFITIWLENLSNDLEAFFSQKWSLLVWLLFGNSN